MTENYGFFGSAVGDDRDYDQLAMAAVWKRILRDGVFEGVDSELAVSASSPAGMSVSLASGWAWVQGYWYQNDAAKTLTIGTANPTYPRIDRVILRLDVLSGRTIGAVVLAGTPAASPSAPSLTQTADTYEISLAQVVVAAGVTSIVAGNITDERWDDTLCGYAEPHAIGLESVAVREDKDMGGSYTLTNLPTPGAATEAATKGYVDEIIGAASNVIAVSGKTYLCVNATWTGAAWNRLSTGSPAWAIELSHSGDAVTVKRVAAGANPITWVDLLVLSNASDLKVTSISERVGSAGIVLNHFLDASAGGIKGGMVNQTGSRSLNTSYQNTGAGEREVHVGITATGGSLAAAGFISANGSDWTQMQGQSNAGANTGLTLCVPSGYYYKITATNGSIAAWWERG